MTKLALLFAVLFLLFVGTPGPSTADPSTDAPFMHGQSSQPEFVFNVYRAVVKGKPNDNVMISPYGIQKMLDLARHGAGGQTRTEIEKVLGYAESISWDASSDGTLTIADALWVQQDFSIFPEFLQTARERFGSSVEQADFSRNPNEAVKQINAWCSKNTKGKIPTLFSHLDEDTRFVLASAIHFAADWKIQFNRTRTQTSDFTLLDGSKVKTKLMARTSRTNYGETDDAFVVELLYEDEDYAMVILLPKKPANFGQWESAMSIQKFNFIRRSMRMCLVDLRMPKFTLENHLPLNDMLKQLGMRTAFDEYKADFKKIAHVEGRPLYVGDVLQKTFIKVDEKGTEAAAITGVRIPIGCSAPERPLPFHADYPFLYAIVKRDTILFLGRFVKPDGK